MNSLGCMVDKDSIHTNPDKVRVVQNFPFPTAVNNVGSFFGISRLLPCFHSRFCCHCFPTYTPSQDIPFQWNDPQQCRFEFLKVALTNAPILVFPDYNLPFTICTDASIKGIGAVFMQQVEPRRPHVIAYLILKEIFL